MTNIPNCYAGYLDTLTCLVTTSESENCTQPPSGSTIKYDSASCGTNGNICSTCAGTITVPTGYKASNGATRVTAKIKLSCATEDYTSLNKIYVKTCSCEPATPVTCDTANGYTGTPYIIDKTFQGCSKSSTTVKCNPGEYAVFNGCEKCPSLYGVDAITALRRTKYLITDCYIPKDSVITDETGTYILTDDCNYTYGSTIVGSI